ncbi:MAG: hypothetical protein ACJ8AH_18100 [Stellaceae bacterium]
MNKRALAGVGGKASLKQLSAHPAAEGRGNRKIANLALYMSRTEQPADRTSICNHSASFAVLSLQVQRDAISGYNSRLYGSKSIIMPKVT